MGFLGSERESFILPLMALTTMSSGEVAQMSLPPHGRTVSVFSYARSPGHQLWVSVPAEQVDSGMFLIGFGFFFNCK